MKKLLPIEEIQDVISYDPISGYFRWKVKRNGRNGGVRPGDLAGKLTNCGYISIGVKRNEYLAHRLAWLFVHKKWPTEDIDHINGNPVDNSIANLREVPHSVNLENRHKSQSNNSSGYLGVSHIKSLNKWKAEICVKGKRLTLGTFSTPQDAHKCYLSAKRMLHIGCTI